MLHNGAGAEALTRPLKAARHEFSRRVVGRQLCPQGFEFGLGVLVSSGCRRTGVHQRTGQCPLRRWHVGLPGALFCKLSVDLRQRGVQPRRQQAGRGRSVGKPGGEPLAARPSRSAPRVSRARRLAGPWRKAAARTTGPPTETPATHPGASSVTASQARQRILAQAQGHRVGRAQGSAQQGFGVRQQTGRGAESLCRQPGAQPMLAGSSLLRVSKWWRNCFRHIRRQGWIAGGPFWSVKPASGWFRRNNLAAASITWLAPKRG